MEWSAWNQFFHLSVVKKKKPKNIVLNWKNFKLEILVSLEIYLWICMKHNFFL